MDREPRPEHVPPPSISESQEGLTDAVPVSIEIDTSLLYTGKTVATTRLPPVPRTRSASMVPGNTQDSLTPSKPIYALSPFHSHVADEIETLSNKSTNNDTTTPFSDPSSPFSSFLVPRVASATSSTPLSSSPAPKSTSLQSPLMQSPLGISLASGPTLTQPLSLSRPLSLPETLPRSQSLADAQPLPSSSSFGVGDEPVFDHRPSLSSVHEHTLTGMHLRSASNSPIPSPQTDAPMSPPVVDFPLIVASFTYRAQKPESAWEWLRCSFYSITNPFLGKLYTKTMENIANPAGMVDSDAETQLSITVDGLQPSGNERADGTTRGPQPRHLPKRLGLQLPSMDLLPKLPYMSTASATYICTYGVWEHLRGLGLASHVLSSGLMYMYTSHASWDVYLHVLSDNTPAIKLYLRHGFTIRENLKDHYYFNGKYHDALLLGYIYK